jgi:hypothetical protein
LIYERFPLTLFHSPPGLAPQPKVNALRGRPLSFLPGSPNISL